MALAIPLYQQITLLKKNGLAIFLGIFFGVLSSLLSILAMSYMFGLSHREYVTLLPKSITTAIGIGVADELGGITGVLSSLLSILAMSYMFGLSHREYVTLLPKSITTAIGIGVADELGGITTITVAVIIVTGVLGNVIGQAVCKVFKIYEPIAVGLAFGTSAHAVGTAKALEIGEVEGAMSSLSIVVSGLMTVVGASVFAMFL